jgi:hypothetical protein
LVPSLFLWYHGFMAKTSVVPKKRRGPAPTGKGTQIQVRLQPEQLAELDAWIEKQEIQPTRPEAIRGMIDAMLYILAKDPGEKPVSKSARASRARELAAKAIDEMIDPSAPPEERAQRRSRLTKGPEEFREARVDRPKAKKGK